MWGRLTVFFVLGLLPACSFVFDEAEGLNDGGGAPSIDAEGDIVDAGPGGCTTQSAYLNTCLLSASGDRPDLNEADLKTYILDTLGETLTLDQVDIPIDGQTIEQIGGGDIFVWKVQSFRLRPNSSLRVMGTIPLAIVAEEDIVIEGLLDIASRVVQGECLDNSFVGAGGNSMDCPTQGLSDAKQGRAGGGGGGFGTKGGESVAVDGTIVVPGGAVVTATRIRGGCAGGVGGVVDVCEGRGGHGGGALLLHAAGNIQVRSAGSIHTGGGGGFGGSTMADLSDVGSTGGGGGGGGSGGMIAMEASMVQIAIGAQVFANGGGGGEGGHSGANGSPGSDGSGPAVAVGGGATGPADGGVGGSGAVGQTAASDGNANLNVGAGSGGGGGGVGVFEVRAALHVIPSGANVSPQPTVFSTASRL